MAQYKSRHSASLLSKTKVHTLANSTHISTLRSLSSLKLLVYTVRDTSWKAHGEMVPQMFNVKLEAGYSFVQGYVYNLKKLPMFFHSKKAKGIGC